MTLYQFLLLTHVLAVVVWLGGSLATLTLWRRALATGDPGTIASQAATQRWFDLRISLPAALVVLAAGGWLMTEGDWGMDQGWLHVGMTAVFVGAGSVLWTTRVHQRVADSHASAGPASRATVGMVAAVAVTLIALWAMVVKP